MTAEPMAASGFLDAWRDAYAASRNPLYALSALASWPAGEPLADWLREALQRLAVGALRLEAEHWQARDEPGAAQQAVQRLPAALGFTRPGWNAFQDAAGRNEAAWTALHVAYLAGASGSREAAVRHLMSETRESRATVFGKISKAKASGLSRK